jgi:BirA family transcriptional regulator, biotin operon repressor / biotin---[acetyl-CoA-carboxylase] ligase
MKDAAKLAERGEPHGTVVVAEEQTAGIGRHGHTWHSPPAGGLYISIILRLDHVLPVLTMALGLAVARAIDAQCDIRWPNDVMLNGRKLAGVMVQTAEKGVLIAGIGVNANQTQFPEELRDIATSLRIETGRDHEKPELLERIVAECLAYAEKEKQEILDEFTARSSYVWGKQVNVDTGSRTFSGVTAGLDENGFLLVETETGIETVIAGGVRAAS